MLNTTTTATDSFNINRLQSDEDQLSVKAYKYGVGSLSDPELLALIMGYESESKAREAIQHYNTITNMVNDDAQSLNYNISNKSEAVKLSAIGEISKRIATNSCWNRSEKIQFISPETVSAFMGPKLRHEKKERFHVLLLDNAKNLIKDIEISKGSANATIVEPAEVLRQAILNNAISIILVHNHPSGVCRASTADINLTKRIHESGKLLGIPVDDHVIIAGYEFVSLRSERLFN